MNDFLRLSIKKKAAVDKTIKNIQGQNLFRLKWKRNVELGKKCMVFFYEERERKT